ncbi:MAG TPA: hypothetical protein DCO75_07780, partial [Fibrobacteres bacterium]|nr:hypothetical protein [Fibrobacterota bacterium]
KKLIFRDTPNTNLVRHAPFIGEIFALRFSIAMRTFTYNYFNIIFSCKSKEFLNFGLLFSGCRLIKFQNFTGGARRSPGTEIFSPIVLF